MAQTIRAGWYYAAKYKGNNGDLILGVVQSVRHNGHIVLTNMLTGKTSTKKREVLERRNKRISKPRAMKLREMFLEHGDKKKVRDAAVSTPEFGSRKVKKNEKEPQLFFATGPKGGVFIPKDKCDKLIPVLSEVLEILRRGR